MHFQRQGLEPLGQDFDRFGQLRVLLEHIDQECRLLGRKGLALIAGARYVFAVLGIRFRMCFVAIRLSGLGEQDQRRGIGGLQAEGEVQENKRVNVELGPAHEINDDPERHDDGLADEKYRRTKKPREGLGFEREPIIAEYRA